jgi:hypothetical protein
LTSIVLTVGVFLLQTAIFFTAPLFQFYYNPAQTLSDEAVNVDLVAPVSSKKPEHNSVQVNQTLNITQPEIQPAQGWVIKVTIR